MPLGIVHVPWMISQHPKYLAATNILRERRSHEHHSVDHLNPSADWSATCLAV